MEWDCTIHVAKTKALIRFAVTAKLICVFVLAYAKSQFSHDAAQLQVLMEAPLRDISNKYLQFIFCWRNKEKKIQNITKYPS